jgi:hypothetical protein
MSTIFCQSPERKKKGGRGNRFVRTVSQKTDFRTPRRATATPREMRRVGVPVVGTSDSCVSFSGALLLVSRAIAWRLRERVPAFSKSAGFHFSGFNGYGELSANRLVQSVISKVVY